MSAAVRVTSGYTTYVCEVDPGDHYRPFTLCRINSDIIRKIYMMSVLTISILKQMPDFPGRKMLHVLENPN